MQKKYTPWIIHAAVGFSQWLFLTYAPVRNNTFSLGMFILTAFVFYVPNLVTIFFYLQKETNMFVKRASTRASFVFPFLAVIAYFSLRVFPNEQLTLRSPSSLIVLALFTVFGLAQILYFRWLLNPEYIYFKQIHSSKVLPYRKTLTIGPKTRIYKTDGKSKKLVAYLQERVIFNADDTPVPIGVVHGNEIYSVDDLNHAIGTFDVYGYVCDADGTRLGKVNMYRKTIDKKTEDGRRMQIGTMDKSFNAAGAALLLFCEQLLGNTIDNERNDA